MYLHNNDFDYQNHSSGKNYFFHKGNKPSMKCMDLDVKNKSIKNVPWAVLKQKIKKWKKEN